MQLSETYNLSWNKVTRNRKCLICNKEVYGRVFVDHLLSAHLITGNQYIIKYGYNNIVPICEHPECNNITNFHNYTYGYSRYCSHSCHMKILSAEMWNDETSGQYTKIVSKKQALHIGNLMRDINKSNNTYSDTMYLYVGVSKLNSKVFKIGISSTTSTRLDHMHKMFDIIFTEEIYKNNAIDIENTFINKYKDYLYIDIDRYELVGHSTREGSGVTELLEIGCLDSLLSDINNAISTLEECKWKYQ